ncbi:MULTISPECIES: pirin family protein [Sphingobacterium]|uniref:pirin family protein n=1 Tax=Sphingobacterium TaxID=28453 RepID=UPI00104F0755|nr:MULTISPECIES: pirin-like C-terminal cupin domain-containing protein [Sphingobacterium]MCW2264034.1 redox-sensitive bicupin YhaK (pirin superfamily) [Sphingobacterium kitahiroshimense]TCR14980.1 hypothetical protein EDF67_1011087 [Sphingobacterium sp. JUb78]
MAIKRKVTNRYVATGHQGFMGADHIARSVIQVEFPESDPFIMLMDDFLDKSNNEPVGGAHPHAGFEIVSLLIDGKMEGIEAGGMQVLTTGSGMVHTETIEEKALLHLMQLWINIPKAKRNIAPKLQDIKLDKIPTIVKDDVSIRVYTGALGGVNSPVVTNVPLIIADIKLNANASTTLHIPSSYTTFLYILNGNVFVGEESKSLSQYDVGWLDRMSEDEESELLLTSGAEESRLLLYSAQPLGEKIVSQGPFIADSADGIADLYKKYRQGKLPHINTFTDDDFIKF